MTYEQIISCLTRHNVIYGTYDKSSGLIKIVAIPQSKMELKFQRWKNPREWSLIVGMRTYDVITNDELEKLCVFLQFAGLTHDKIFSTLE